MAAIGFTATRYTLSFDRDDEVKLVLMVPLTSKAAMLALAAVPGHSNIAVAITPL